ncbi:MAG TPA: TrbC/VirB2 family protein [Castellaniella sp.]|uniref:TrbC/VirB2 family protein n=1 Tax=Castellaniella sp. TaxID=1955812 RepID=UPI002F1549EC
MPIPQHIKNKTTRGRFAHTLATAWLLAGIQHAAFAQSMGGLSRAKTTLQTLKDNLDVILPIAAVIIGVIIFVLYSAEVMRKDDAIRWGIGVLLAGSAAELVVLLWK